MARGRGRPALDPEEKAARKAERDAKAAVHDWDARLPSEPEKRVELLDGLRRKQDDLAEQTKGIRDEIHVSGEIKRLTKVFGLRKPALNVKRIMDRLPSEEERTAVWHQVQMMASDCKWDSAPGLFDVDMIGRTAPEDGSIFDKTGAGEKQAAERGDDPGRARKRGGGPPAAPVDTGSLSTEPGGEAEQAFNAANAAAGMGDFRAEEADEPDVRARFMREQPDPEPVAKPARGKRKAPLEGADASGSYSLS